MRRFQPLRSSPLAQSDEFIVYIHPRKNPYFTHVQLARMDAVDIPSERVPEGLKACEQILKRGKEVKKVEPVVTYWCCFAAAQKALDARNRSKEDTVFLMSLLDALEQMKIVLANNDAVTNEAAGAAYIENFALKVFMSADNDDRNGTSGKATIRKFVVAGQFIEVLRCFENGMTEEMEQKLQYARWKAADGAKALREGRAPTSGPPIPDVEFSLPELPSGSPSANSQNLSSSAQTTPLLRPTQSNNNTITPIISPRPSPASQPRPNLPGLDTSGDDRPLGRNGSTASGAWSTVATPGLTEEDEIERHFALPTVPPAGLSDDRGCPPGSGGGGNGGEKKNVRFTGPDGAPLSPAQTHMTVDSYDSPDAPPPSAHGGSPTRKHSPPALKKEDNSSSSRSGSGSAPTTASSGTPISGSGGVGRTGDSSSSRSRGDSNASRATAKASPSAGNKHDLPPARPAVVPPPPPPSLVSYPSVPPVTAQPNGLGLTSPPHSAPPMSAMPCATPHNNPIPKLTRKQVEQTQKHARWAVSALEFDDAETARLELRKALAILGG